MTRLVQRIASRGKHEHAEFVATWDEVVAGLIAEWNEEPPWLRWDYGLSSAEGAGGHDNLQMGRMTGLTAVHRIHFSLDLTSAPSRCDMEIMRAWLAKTVLGGMLAARVATIQAMYGTPWPDDREWRIETTGFHWLPTEINSVVHPTTESSQRYGADIFVASYERYGIRDMRPRWSYA